MGERGIGRRGFLRAGAGVVAGAALGKAAAADADPKAPDPKTVVNHNPKMHYRRLGKTDLWLSEVSLGGHWKNRDGGRYWDTFANDEIPKDVAKNRSDVISACIDAGVNYLDITTAAECLSYGAALKGRREKMIVGADDHRLGPRNPRQRNVKDLTYNIDECLRRLKFDYLDIWRVQADMGGNHTDPEVEVMIETFEKAKEAGKVRHFGISSHSRPWLQHVIEKYPQIEMVIFPCTAKTREAGKPATKENVQEVNPGHGSNMGGSIFESVRKTDTGLVTIKPFTGGGSNFFPSQPRFPVVGVGLKEENDLARLTLQAILTIDAITATVPGLTTVYEVENAARASYSRPLAMLPADREWLVQRMDACWANLPEEYAWLRDWEVV
ncbi:MAG: aldo/keto reductase [Planctomycetes bacterium]|nr:aldo/keto reductase [Planctomycetota bacterium]